MTARARQRPETTDRQLDAPWARPWEGVADALDASPDEGLNAEEIARRRKRHGPNRLRRVERRPAWRILLEQFQSVIVALLAVAAILSFVFGEFVEGMSIVAVIFLNTAIGFATELRAVRSMEALQQLGSVDAMVHREGEVQEVSAEELVPGDLVLLVGGDVVTADLRLIEASKLQVDESTLTGESVPVDKQVEPVDEDAPLAERSSMLFKGTAVTRGSGEGIVVTTGMETELGQISSLVEEAEEGTTPLERRLAQLGQRLIWVTLAIVVLVATLGILRGGQVLLMIRAAIALAVASVPEGLPIVATVALARGMWRMARRNALINHLSAVETLGATNTILTDKTGTLTENRMTVTRIALEAEEIHVGGSGLEIEGEFSKDGEPTHPSEDDRLREVLEVAMLCNNASLHRGENGEITAVGEPTEVALLVAGAKAGLDHDQLVSEMPEVREEAFDPQIKMMATIHREDGRYRVAVKGAAESVLEASSHILAKEGRKEISEDRQRWPERNAQMAEEGLRVMALGTKTADTADIDPYERLTFLGLAGLVDPPRGDVEDAIDACKDAGIEVIMLTGDQPATARHVALAVGLIDDAAAEVIHGRDLKSPEEMTDEERQRVRRAPVFARVSPRQKLDLIALHQEDGSIVAMTGDGVNDAPALKKADIGIAMGQRGTQVAREAADMVLMDDAFPTIVIAVEQGRAIFNNIRRFVLYLLSCNVAEVMVVALAAIADAPLPIRPLQILYLNLVTDVFPALALGVGEGDPGTMQHPPRDPQESILMDRHWLAIAGYSALITASVLGALAWATTSLGMDGKQAVTVSFLTLAFAQLWHVFNMRDRKSRFLRNDVVGNPYIWGALILSIFLLLIATYAPGLSDVLNTVHPGARGWAVIVGLSLVPWMVGQILKQTGIL